jgi:transcriptional regulator with XRE-family HTH domain
MTAEEVYRKQMGQFLKTARKKAGVTQIEVANLCGLKNAQFISNIERGTCWPPTHILLEMSKLYGVSRSDLLEKLVFYRKKVWAFDLGIGTRSKISGNK